MTEKPTPQEDAIDELPPLDDDGSTFDDGDDSHGITHHGDVSDLDDATAEKDPIDAWVGAELVADEGGLLADDEPDERIAPDEDVALGGDEGGLLEGSDEGDGRDVTAEEAGIFAGDEEGADDGGAEGTGDDPSSAIDEALLRAPLTVAGPDDAELEDETFYDRVDSNERDPWPSRADVAWTVERADSTPPRRARRSTPPPRLSLPTDADTLVASEGALVAAARYGEALALSLDRGERFVQVAHCTQTCALATIPGAPGGRALAVALWDAAKDASALVVVRLVQNTPVAELVAELAPTHVRPETDDDDEYARVQSLEVEVMDKTIVVVARGRFGALRIIG